MSKRGFRSPFDKGMEDRPAEDPGSLREENRRLRRAVEELSILNDLAQSIGASVDSQDIIRKIVDTSMRAVQAEQTVVTLVDRLHRSVGDTLFRARTRSSQQPQYHLTEPLLGWMHHNKRPLLSIDPTSDERLRGVTWEQSIHSLLCVPLMAKSALIGVITSYNKKGGGSFTEEDQRLLSIIASQSAQIIENARLYEKERELAEVKEQLKMAAQIQRDLLPKTPPSIPGYDLAGASIPALEVGGDYFDFIPLNDGRISVCLGDVSGKGLPAALLMANLQATLRGLTAPDIPLASTIARSNQLLHRSTDPGTFVTLFVGVLDPSTGVVSYCNAGHEHPMLFRRDGRVERLSVGGMALGAIDTFPYEESTTVLEPGDFLVVYSDGIPEAMDEVGNFFGEEHLLACILGGELSGAAELLQRVVVRVRDHEHGAPRADDLTIVVVRRLP
jgi:sigma-B regulation protein RsbU (phosphoserine phosphatase)